MSGLLSRMDPSLVIEVLRNPADHPVSVAVLLAAATLILLIALLVLLVFLLGRGEDTRSSRSRNPARRVDAPRPQTRPAPNAGASRRTTSVTRGLLTAGVALLFVLSVYASGSLNSACAGCHTITRETESWQKGPHSRVACVSCHETRPVLLFPSHAAQRVSNLARYALDSPAYARVSEVDDTGCVSCHRKELATVVTGPGKTASIRMRHADVMSAGYHCTDCHRDTGHAVSDGAPSGLSGMQRCLGCHNGRTAQSACPTCHVRDVMLASAQSFGSFPKIDMPSRDCSGCHSMAKCDACHGLRMPHPAAFVQGDHARDAAFGKKRACWKCHQPADCGKCHQLQPTGFSAHRPDWQQTHGRGRAAKLMDDPNACRVCHHLSPGVQFCRRCHPK